MGASRTSNKDIADRLDTLIDLLTATAIAAPAATTVETPAITEGDVKVDEAYLAHMNLKAADHATTKGEEVVLYARKNKAGETKLAYALRGRYDEVVKKQPSCIGPVGSFKP
jgi:hypothetical protein